MRPAHAVVVAAPGEDVHQLLKRLRKPVDHCGLRKAMHRLEHAQSRSQRRRAKECAERRRQWKRMQRAAFANVRDGRRGL